MGIQPIAREEVPEQYRASPLKSVKLWESREARQFLHSVQHLRPVQQDSEKLSAQERADFAASIRHLKDDLVSWTDVSGTGLVIQGFEKGASFLALLDLSPDDNTAEDVAAAFSSI